MVQGMDAGLYQKLKPLVCALPMARQQININTLDVTQSVILEALFDPWLSPVQARALLQQRPAKGWEDVDQFLAQPLLADVDERTKKQLKTVLSVDSNYFWLRSDITVNEIELTRPSIQSSVRLRMTCNCARDTRRQRLTKLTPHPRAIRARALSTFLPVHIQRLL